jgi:uncharacterized repeat protein (TIGR03803 family)
MTRQAFLSAKNLAVCFALSVLVGAGLAAAQTETVIHAFQSNSATDGINPTSGLVADSNGALYGTTPNGGKYRYGTVYKLAPPATQGGAWKQNILYSFANGLDGANPSGNLVLNTRSGKIYGAARYFSGYNTSVVFELTPPAQPGKPWTESVVYGFQDSITFYAGVFSLISDSKGRLYGTTYDGGRYKSGSVFALSLGPGNFWNKEDIYSFQSNAFGFVLPGGLALDSAGVLYGLTGYGDTVFSLTPPAGGRGAWTENVLHAFGSPGDGELPAGGLVLDNNGALYGTTDQGGQFGAGTVFQLAPPAAQGGAWTENVLYSFQGSGDGANPIAGVILDAAGALYGTTQYGGDFACSYNGNYSCGAAFKLVPPSSQGYGWTEQTLHGFAGGSDGAYPGQAPLFLLDTTLYGTTSIGGYNGSPCYGVGCGTVFSITQ